VINSSPQPCHQSIEVSSQFCQGTLNKQCIQEVILVKENDLLLSPKSYKGFVGFGMVDDVAVDNRGGGVAWRRGGGWVSEGLRTASGHWAPLGSIIIAPCAMSVIFA